MGLALYLLESDLELSGSPGGWDAFVEYCMWGRFGGCLTPGKSWNEHGGFKEIATHTGLCALAGIGSAVTWGGNSTESLIWSSKAREGEGDSCA